jgi:glycogen operon protein
VLRDFTRRLIRLRREHCTFRRETFLRGREVNGSALPDVWWFRTDGRKMTSRDWQHGEAVLGMFLNGEAIATPGPRGEEISDDSFVLLFNAHAEDRVFKLPRRRMGARWELELCTADPAAPAGSATYEAQSEINVTARSITILKRVR